MALLNEAECHLDSTRSCGTTARCTNRYRRSQLENIAKSCGLHAIQKKSMNDLCRMIRKSPAFQVVPKAPDNEGHVAFLHKVIDRLLNIIDHQPAAIVPQRRSSVKPAISSHRSHSTPKKISEAPLPPKLPPPPPPLPMLKAPPPPLPKSKPKDVVKDSNLLSRALRDNPMFQRMQKEELIRDRGKNEVLIHGGARILRNMRRY